MILLPLLAAGLYLLPIVAFTALRSRRSTSLWQSATDIPLAVALDLMGVLILARFMRLELASLVSRVLWVVGLTLWTVWRAKKGDVPKWPSEIDRRLSANALVQSAFAVLCSLTLSRFSNVWDREWHIPLTASLRGQRLPFGNVYEPRGELAYHYTGDVLASMLQTFSLDAMHSALALSLAHDVMFGLLGIVVTFTLAAAGIKRLAVQWSVLGAMVFAGPLLFAQNPKEPGGYSIGNLLSLSYRPHVSLAYVLTMGFAAALLAGVYRSKADARARVFPALAAVSAVLAITDETTLVLLGLWIGVVWLYDPGSLANTRLRGLLKLLLLVVAIGASILVFGGALGLHAERYPMWLVAPRAPGWSYAPEPLTKALGRSRVAEDMFTVFGVFVAAVGVVFSARRRETRTVAISFLTVALAATLGLTCVDFNHRPIENHRWVTLAFLFAPLLAAFMLAEPDPPGAPRRTAGLAALLVYLSCGLGAASTVDWLWTGPGLRMRHQQFVGGLRTNLLYETDCRATTGAHWFEQATPTYAEERGVYLWAGCHPTFVAGPTVNADGHKIKVGGPNSGASGLNDVLRNMLEPGAPVVLACISDESHPDHICSAAQAKDVGDCKPSGTDYALCLVPSAKRKRLTHP